MKIRLTDADRALYDDGPEWLEWDPGRFTVSEAEAFQAHIRDAQDNPVPIGEYRLWLGSKEVVQVKWAIWLSLRRAGAVVEWDALDPDILGADWIFDEPAPGSSAGKARGRSTRQRRSASGESGTPQP